MQSLGMKALQLQYIFMTELLTSSKNYHLMCYTDFV